MVAEDEERRLSLASDLQQTVRRMMAAGQDENPGASGYLLGQVERLIVLVSGGDVDVDKR